MEVPKSPIPPWDDSKSPEETSHTAENQWERADLLPTIVGGPNAAVRHLAGNGTSVSASGNASGTGGSGNTIGNGTGTGNTVGTGGGNGTGTGGASSVTSAGSTVDTYSLFAGVSAFELDLFGRVRNLARAAQEQYFASQSGADATRISLIAEIANAWLTMAADQEQLRIANETVRSFAESVRITGAQFQRGIASQVDVAQADTNLQQAVSDVGTRTTQVAQDQNALNLLVGTTVPAALLPATLAEQDATLADLPAGIASTVLLNRPDVIQAEDQLKAQNANIGAARAAFFPRITLTAAAGTASGGLAGLFTGGSFSWNASGSGLLTIFDFGRNRAQLRYAEASRDAAVASYEKAVQTAFREVADALAARGTIDTRIGAQRQRVRSARIAADLSLARYRAGVDPYLDTLVTQRTAYEAEQTLVTTRLLRASNLVTLYSALGGGLAG